MPHRQKHRGQQSEDPKLFSLDWLPVLNEAVTDMSYLMSRGYSHRSSLKIVGDRYKLHRRQRHALYRASCSDQSRTQRAGKLMDVSELKNKQVIIDGYNLLISVESALSGGIIIDCRDDTFRDLASVHSTYRTVAETRPAINLIGEQLESLCIAGAYWLLDAPISNSGRLKHLMEGIAEEKGFHWQIELDNSPDKRIKEEKESVAITSDGQILDHVDTWTNLHRHIIEGLSESQIIQLKGIGQ
ncbi:MAG: DUF434 domain-containing protein [Bacteroidota bacterium]